MTTLPNVRTSGDRITLLCLAMLPLICLIASPVQAETALTATDSSADEAAPDDGATPTAVEKTSLELPAEALRLLAQSLRDSCAICAERNREKAFSQLDEFYVPGRLITMAGETRFIVSDDNPNELEVFGYAGTSPELTFRFHYEGSRLVGVEEADETEAVWVEEVARAGATDQLEGTIEIIPYPYGDGVSYLFSPTEGHLQVQCRILEIAVP